MFYSTRLVLVFTVRIVKTINRYIIVEAFSYFIVSLFAFTGLILVARILTFTDLIVNKGVKIEQIGMVFLAIIPTFLEIALPLSALLGVLMAFGRLSADSEIVVLRASGLSLFQLIKPVFIFAIFATITCYIVTSKFRPWGFRQLEQTFFEIARSKSTAGLDAGIFNKLGKIVLYSENINHQTGALAHTLIDDKREDERRQIIFAERGVIIPNEENRTITLELYDGIIHEEYKGRYNLTKFEINHLSMSSDDIYNPDAKKRTSRIYKELAGEELKNYIDSLQTKMNEIKEKASDRKLTSEEKYEINELQKIFLRSKIDEGRRVSMPFAAFLLALIAMPLGIQPPRMQKTWGVSISITLAVVIFATYYAIMSIGIALAEGGSWPPLLALWLPNVITAIFTIFLLKQMGTEKWQSIAEGIEAVLVPFIKKIKAKKQSNHKRVRA